MPRTSSERRFPPEMHDMPLTNQKPVHCQHLTDLADNIQRRKDYIINIPLEWRFDCVEHAVAWLQKYAPYIEGLQEWLEEHKEDWLNNC
ncbi:hypothetical protein EYC80_006393 [Monilinia laxa]|uniref:Uncharacterized protein n=1 Tax=Monilinia laxa TaxID=61186 RepID=A0A5N6JRT6_MONLA|nr:hypothetical protein EYC80_006393 [Monilinia laxa]